MSKERTRAEAIRELHRRGIPIFAGGAPTDNPVQWPLGPPTVNGDGSVSVEMMLKQPTRITAMIRDLTLEQFLLDKIFVSSGGVTGGAVVYDRPLANDLYLTRDVAKIEPGSEFPIIKSEHPVPKVAAVEKWGAKTFVTWEARDRNDRAALTDEIRKMANTIVRKLNQRAIEELDKVFTEFGAQTWAGNKWELVDMIGPPPDSYGDQPVGDFVSVLLHNENLGIGMTHDTWLMNPQEMASMMLCYGENWRSVFEVYGYTNIVISKQVAAGTAYSLASGQVGEMRIEQPLRTYSWPDKDGREMDWIQTSVRPVMFVRNPYAVVKITGLHT